MDMKRDSVPWTKQRNEPCSTIHPTIRQHECIQAQIVVSKQTTEQDHSSNLASSSSHNTASIIPMLLVAFLLVTSLLSPALSLSIVSDSSHSLLANQTFHPGSELHKLKSVRGYLRKINKPAVKTIQAHTFVFLVVLYAYIFILLEAYWSGFLFILAAAEPRWWCYRLCAISSPTSFWPSSAERT